MDFNNAWHPGEPGNQYVRYHYFYGRNHNYGMASRLGTDSSSHEPINRQIIPITSKDVWRDEGPQTVEQLINQGYLSLPASEPITSMLSDRKHTSWLGLEDVLGQIREREEIYKQNMLDIGWDMCYAFNELTRGGWPPTDEQEEGYAKRMQLLHADQRDERVTAWRDIARLRERVPETVQLYLSAFRKMDILNDDGDAP